MSKVVYSMMVSLDGYIEGPNRELEWGVVDEELHSYLNQRERATSAYLFGRRTYESMVGYWSADPDPSSPSYIQEYARIWKKTPKIVFSKTLDQIGGNARLVSDNIVEEIARLKEQHGENLVLGGAELASTFIQLGLIDEFRLYMHPVILGSGKPMFPQMDDLISLRLVETHVFSSGVVFLRYQRADVK